ncbi:hypothetical protein D9M68_609320 [compost metagenome]
MNTTTTDSAGLSCMGRITVNSTTAASTKDKATVATKAAQYGRPACMRLQAMKVENIAISPCAKLMWCVAW